MGGQKGKVREQGIKEGKDRKNLPGVQTKRQAIKQREIQTCLRFLQYSKEDNVLNIYKLSKKETCVPRIFYPAKNALPKPNKTNRFEIFQLM